MFLYHLKMVLHLFFRLDLLLSQWFQSFLYSRSGLLWVVDGPFSHTMVEDDWPSLWDGEPWLNGTADEQRLAFFEPLGDITGDGQPDLYVSGNNVGFLLDRFVPGHQEADVVGRRLSNHLWCAQSVPDLNGDGVAELAACTALGGYQYRVDLYFGDSP